MTLVPMIVGYLFAKKVLKLPILNNMGALCGGMTSTPALGSLIQVAGTDDVASAYASTTNCTCNSCACGADDSAVVLILIKKQSNNYYGIVFYCKLLYNGNYSEFAYIICKGAEGLV